LQVGEWLAHYEFDGPPGPADHHRLRAMEKRMKELLPGLLAGREGRLREITVPLALDLSALSVEDGARAWARAVVREVDRRLASKKRQPARAAQLAPDEEERAAKRLADTVTKELDSTINIDEGRLFRLLTTEHSQSQVNLALDALKEKKVNAAAFDKTYFDLLLEELAAEDEAEYAKFLERLLRADRVRFLLRPTQSTDHAELALEALRAGERENFIANFEDACLQLLLTLVATVEEQAAEAMIHYTPLGVERGEMSPPESKELMSRLRRTAFHRGAGPLKAIEDYEAKLDDLGHWRGRPGPNALNTPIWMPDPLKPGVEEWRRKSRIANDDTFWKAAQEHIVDLQEEYRLAVRDHPVLLAIGLTSADLRKMHTAGAETIAEILRPKLQKVLQDCRRSRAYVQNRNVNVWAMPKVLAIGQELLGIAPGSEAARWIQTEAESKAFWNASWSILLAVVEIALGIGAMIAAPITGGGSVAAWATFISLTAAGIGLGAYSAYRSTVALDRRKALSGATMDRWNGILAAEGLSEEEKYLWVEWAAVVGFGVLEIVGIYKALKLARAVKAFSRGTKPLQVVARELRVSEELLDATIGLRTQKLLKQGHELPPGLARYRLDRLGFKDLTGRLADGELKTLGAAPQSLFDNFKPEDLFNCRAWEERSLAQLADLTESAVPDAQRMARKLVENGEMPGVEKLIEGARGERFHPNQLRNLEAGLDDAIALRKSHPEVEVEVSFDKGRRLTREEVAAWDARSRALGKKGVVTSDPHSIDVVTPTLRREWKRVSTPCPDIEKFGKLLRKASAYENFEGAGLIRSAQPPWNQGWIDFGDLIDHLPKEAIEARVRGYLGQRTNKCRQYLNSLFLVSKKHGILEFKVPK